MEGMDLDNVWNSLVVEGNKSPFKRRLDEKQRLIENLSQDLRVKNQDLIKFEGITKQLTEKLKVFQNQNRENVKVAQEEIDALVDELERRVEAHQALEAEVESIRKEMEHVHKKNRDLEQQTRRLRDEEKVEESLNSTACAFRNKKLKARGFRMLKKSVQASRNIRKVIEKKRTQKQKAVICMRFKAWKRYTAIEKYIRQKNQRKGFKALGNMFCQWKTFTVNWIKVRSFWEEKNERRLKKGMLSWKKFFDQETKKKAQYKKIAQFYEKKIKKRAFKRFADIKKRVEYEPNEEKAAIKKAQKHNVSFVRKQIFFGWRKWAKAHAKPDRLNKQKSNNMRRKNLLKLGLKVWKTYMNITKQVYAKIQRKVARKNVETKAKSLKLWKYYVNNVLPKTRLQETQKEMFIKKRMLKVWIDQLEAKRKFNTKVDRASKLHNKNLVKKVFKHLAKLRQKRKQLYYFKNVIETKRVHSEASKCFDKWFGLFKTNQKSKKEVMETRKESLDVYFQAWKKYHKMSFKKKNKLIKVQKYMARAEVNKVMSIFNGWARVTRIKRRNEEVVELLASRRRLTLYKNIIFEFMKNARHSMRLKVNKMSTKSSILEGFNISKAKVRDNIEYVKDLDEEKAEMEDRTVYYRAEIDQMSYQIEEKNREIVNMRRVLQQYEKNEKNLVEELAHKSHILQDLEVKVVRSDSKKDFVYGEYEKELEFLRKERTILQNKVEALENELESRHDALEQSEKNLHEKAGQAHGVIRELEKKVENSIKAAGEYKNAAEKKEEQVNSLVAQLQKALEEKEEMNKRLMQAMDENKDIREFYEGRLRFLENQVNIMLLQFINSIKNSGVLKNVEYLKGDLSIQQKKISDLKSDLLNSHHKLEVAKERAQQDAEIIEKTSRYGHSRSPSFGEHPETISPRTKTLTIADSEEYKLRQLVIDQKYMNRAVTPTRGPKLQASSSTTNLKGSDESTHLEVSTKDLLSPLGTLKASSFTPSVRSEKSPLDINALTGLSSVATRDYSPIVGKSGYAQRDSKMRLKPSGACIDDPEFAKTRKERIARREALEKKLGTLSESLQMDLQKSRNKCLY